MPMHMHMHMHMTKPLRLIGLSLALCAVQPSLAGPQASVVGEWRGIAGPERLIFRADGMVRTCFGANSKGNAAMGAWAELAPGRYRITFTHAISPGCAAKPQVIRKYQVEILGLATATAKSNELALYVSGEGPPDRYARVTAAAAVNSTTAGNTATTATTMR